MLPTEIVMIVCWPSGGAASGHFDEVDSDAADMVNNWILGTLLSRATMTMRCPVY